MQRLLDHGDLRIPSGFYFVLRNNSEDSRYWGLVPAGAIVGKPLLVYLSLRDPGAADDGPASNPASQPGLLAALAHIARWHRTLHVVH